MLDLQKNKQIEVKLRSGKIVTGVLRDFDVHMTMKMDSAKESSKGAGDGAEEEEEDLGSVLLRGDNILTISIPDDADGDDDDDDDDDDDAATPA